MQMSNHPTPSSRYPILRRFWKPAIVTGAGGTAVAVWVEEIVMFGEGILALIFLPILASVVYLLDILIFKSRMPQREDVKNTKDKGANK
jgi:hypothetical protein